MGIALLTGGLGAYQSVEIYTEDGSSVVNAGRLSLIGGSSAPTSTEFLLSGQFSTWQKGFPLLEPTGGACALPLSVDSFLVTGGFDGDNHRHTVMYNTTEGTARRLQDMIRGRWYHGCSRLMNSTFSGVL